MEGVPPPTLRRLRALVALVLTVALGLFSRQSFRTGCGADVNRIAPGVLFESAHIEQVLVHPELPGSALSVQINVIWKPPPIHFVSKRAYARQDAPDLAFAL